MTGAALALNIQKLQSNAINMFEIKHNMSTEHINDVFETLMKRYDLRNADTVFSIYKTI